MPAPGGAWGSFLPGGVAAVAAWWGYGLIRSMWRSSPTLGAHSLVVVPHHGPPVRIHPIGSFAQVAEQSSAGAARRAVQAAIDRARAEPGPGHPPVAPPGVTT